MLENRSTKQSIFIFLWLGIWLCIHLVLVWDGGQFRVFNSPDASAQYHFAERIFQGQPFAISLADLSPVVREFLFTRSTKVVDDTLVPVGFVGQAITYGIISKLLFINVIPYLTILLSALGLWYFYKLLLVCFDQKIALLSLMLASIHPAWWYYTNDSLFPNIPFISIAVIASYYWLTALRKARMASAVIAGVCIAGALWFRVSEALWFVPMLMIIGFQDAWRQKRIACLALATASASLLLLWVVQGNVVGNFAISQYAAPIDIASLDQGFLAKSMPFGFHPRVIFKYVMSYGFLFFWPYTVLAMLGGLVYIKTFLQETFASRAYVIASLSSTAIVWAVYGSWHIIDSPDPSLLSIGTSYVRYFLPWYILCSVPMAARALIYLFSRLKGTVRFAVAIAVFVALVFFTYGIALTGSAESSMAKRETLKEYEAMTQWVTQHTPKNAIIVSAKGDKYFWPHRLVISATDHPRVLAAISEAVSIEQIPVYYSGVTLTESKREALRERLASAGLSLGEALHTVADISIYPIISE